MTRTLSFNGLDRGTVIEDQFAGVTISANGGSHQAMIFDSANPTGGDHDLASATLKEVLIISEDGDSSDPDDNAHGGRLTFDFDETVVMKGITFKDIEEGARLKFYDDAGTLIGSRAVHCTQDGGEATVHFDVPGTARFEVILFGSGAIDNVIFDDGGRVTGQEGDGIVSNDDAGVVIDTGYTGDPDGDRIDAGDALIAGEAPDDDIVDAQGGNDTILAGLGDDDIYAGAGDDSVDGGAGDDLIFGDSELGGVGNGTVRESFEWDLAGVADEGDISGGFTQDTGNVNVTFSEVSASAPVTTLFSEDAGVVAGIPTDGSPADATSSLDSITFGAGNSATYALDFDRAVENVDFRINDVDGDGIVRVLAFDATGAPITVNLSGGSDVTLSDTDGVAGNDTADSNGGYQPDTSENYSVLVSIPGPVSRIVIEHSQDGANNSGINVTDVYFDAADLTPVAGGDDVLSGGEGDDLLFGESGDDTLDGGAGSDSLSGGDGADLILGGDAGDTVDGGAGGNDSDTLDLRDSGPLRVVSETPDADGNSTSGVVEFLNEDGTSRGFLDFFEIENLLLPNAAPDAVDDTSQTDEDTAITVDLLANDSDPNGDALTVTSVSVPVDQGVVVDNGDGTATFTPAPDFNGEATISYTVADPDGLTDSAVHTVTVTPVNDAPEAVDDAATTPFNASVTISVLANDSDPDGDPLTVNSVSVPADQGNVVNNGDGTLTFTPAEGFDGEAAITYTISDDGGLEDTATVTVLVNDGVVEGTDGDDLIDVDYIDDPEGDRVDNNDAVLPGTDGDDDLIEAGGGNDTVFAGEGSDTVNGGAGDDFIDTASEGTDTFDPDARPDQGYPFASTDPLGFDGDADPEDDRDSVDGGAGNDTIRTGDDRDTITGGAGNDVINAGFDDDIIDGGADDDRIVGGEGNDVIEGGAGNDTIFAGNDPDLGLGFLDITDADTGGISPDRNPDNGRDTVLGGEGDDVIFGADDDDVLDGGAGDDFIDGEIDDDLLTGAAGEDTLIGGQGDDTLDGGADNDTLDGGTGDDELSGGTGDDVLRGGAGDDLADGGAGNDDLQGGAGADTLRGGDDRDVFSNVTAGDEIDGGDGGDDFDTLNLAGSVPTGGSFTIDFTSPDREDGVVNYFDADGNDAGQLVFEDIENIVPCFTPGTKIATPQGERLVEDLQVGDRIITRDNGIQMIRWTGARVLTGAELARAPHLRPVLIQQGALGNALPERDMLVSPNHRMLIANDKTALYFEEREVLVAAKHLIDLDGVDVVDISETTYIHIMFERHEVILSDGTWTESFQPGDHSLAGIGDAQRAEIFELFPALETREGVEDYVSARRSLKKHEARLITK